MSTSKQTAIDITKQYLVKRGYEILETSWKDGDDSCDIIAKDGNILVFVDTTMKTGERAEFSSDYKNARNRRAHERAAIAYLSASAEVTDALMRFDVIELVRMDEERFIVRHHVNAFATPDAELAEAA